jgi:hypothetical protein
VQKAMDTRIPARFTTRSGYHPQGLAVAGRLMRYSGYGAARSIMVLSIAVNALLIVAAGSDRLWSWSCGYLLSAQRIGCAACRRCRPDSSMKTKEAPTPMWSGRPGPRTLVVGEQAVQRQGQQWQGFLGLPGLARRVAG